MVGYKGAGVLSLGKARGNIFYAASTPAFFLSPIARSWGEGGERRLLRFISLTESVVGSIAGRIGRLLVCTVLFWSLASTLAQRRRSSGSVRRDAQSGCSGSPTTVP